MAKNEIIHQKMVQMNFIYNTESGKYWHKHFGRDFEFDMSASSQDTWDIMYNVFNRTIEFGKEAKLKEIQKALGF